MKNKIIKREVYFCLILLCFLGLFSSTHGQEYGSKEGSLVGEISEIKLKEQKGPVISVEDKHKVKNNIRLKPDSTVIQKQIQPENLAAGEKLSVIFREEDGKMVALSATVGKLVGEVSGGDRAAQLKSGQPLRAPTIPALPKRPEPVLPPGYTLPKKTEEITSQAKKTEGGIPTPLPSVTGPFSPISPADKEDKAIQVTEEAKLSKPPLTGFISGEIISLDFSSQEAALVTIKDSEGKETTVTLISNRVVLNQTLPPEELKRGDAVKVDYREEEAEKIAKTVKLLSR